MVMETLRDEDGKAIEKRQYPVPQFCFLSQGYPLTSYRPKHPSRKEQFVLYTLTPVFDKESPAVAGVMACTNNQDLFPFGVDTSTGSSSWSWPTDVPSKQKLASFKEVDPEEVFFKRGAHAPLMIFLGAGNETRRSKAAQHRRAANANRRGWTWERRQSAQIGNSKGQGKGAKG